MEKDKITIPSEYYQDLKDNLNAYKTAINLIKEEIDNKERIKEVLEELENELKSNVG